ENHIIHASDNQLQTDFVLKYLGYQEGYKKFEPDPESMFDLVHHLGRRTRFKLKKENLNNLRCNVVTNINPPMRETVKIEDTPHYAALRGDHDVYENYLKKFDGERIQTDDHSLIGLLELNENI